jgi:hypothetical protein
MSAGRDEQERADRDRVQSREAHWRTAEAGAEAEERHAERRRRPRDQEDDWENEGGALDPGTRPGARKGPAQRDDEG